MDGFAVLHSFMEIVVQLFILTHFQLLLDIVDLLSELPHVVLDGGFGGGPVVQQHSEVDQSLPESSFAKHVVEVLDPEVEFIEIVDESLHRYAIMKS